MYHNDLYNIALCTKRNNLSYCGFIECPVAVYHTMNFILH